MYRTIRNLISRLFKAFSVILYYVTGTHIVSQYRIKKLKNIYKGQRIFVVCNGPSLKPEDLTKIYNAGYKSIGMNQIAYVYPNTPWRVNILVCTDGCIFWKKSKKMIQECEADYKVFNRKDFLTSLSYNGKKIYVHCIGDSILLDEPKFSEDLLKKYYCIGTTAYESIEWARYLGAKEIYLIGCDMSYAVNANQDGSIYYNTSGGNHFYEKDKDELSHVKPVQTWQQKLAHRAADDYSRSNGFRIYNATRGGCLEEYERVDFDSLFGNI